MLATEATDGLTWASAIALSIFFLCLTACILAWFKWGLPASMEAEQRRFDRRYSLRSWDIKTETRTETKREEPATDD